MSEIPPLTRSPDKFGIVRNDFYLVEDPASGTLKKIVQDPNEFKRAQPMVWYSPEQLAAQRAAKYSAAPIASPYDIASENKEYRDISKVFPNYFGNVRGNYYDPAYNKRNNPNKNDMGETSGYKTGLNYNDMIYGRARGKSYGRSKRRSSEFDIFDINF